MDFVEISYQPLYPALKSYFESQQDCPGMLRNFFEGEFSEMFLWLLYSTMHIFHVNVALIEKENISIVKVQNILASVLTAQQGRLYKQFIVIPLKVRSQLNVLSKN